MSKGSKQTGTQTVTQVNPTAEAQLPYLKESWDTAKAFYNNPAVSQKFYPYPIVGPYANADPNLAAGYQNLIGAGQGVQQNLLPTANQAYTGAVGGQYGVQNSPAYAGLQQFAQGQTGPQQQFRDIYGGTGQLTNYAQQAAANNNVGLNSLMGLAQGAGYNNPYLSQAIQGAIDPLVSNYQRAISPQIDAAASQAGRYGSGAQAGMVGTAQENLARGIGNVTANMQNAAYESERGRQLQAASQGGQLYNQGLGLGMQGINQALQQQLSAAQGGAQTQQYGLTGLQGGYQSGNAAALQALGLTPQFLQAQYSSPLAQIQAGQGLWGIGKDEAAYQQQLIDAEKTRWDYNTRLPWTDLGLYQQAIGGALGGSETKSQPIFGNPTADALSGVLGATGIAKNLGLFGSGGGGLGSLFGAGAGGLTAANLFGAGPAIAAFNAAPAAAALPVAVDTLAPAVASLFFGSDRRLKKDDRMIGLLGELPIHEFRYKKGDGQKYIGFMADEVEKLDPSAVATMPNGYKAVNYHRATQSALNSMMG